MRAGPLGDADHVARGDAALVVAVECATAASTCFCTSMGTGPEVEDGADIVLSELDEGFVVRAGTDAGAAVVDRLKLRSAEPLESARAAEQVGRRTRRDWRSDSGRGSAGQAASRTRSSPLGRGGGSLPRLRQLHARLPDLLLHERFGRFRPGRCRGNDGAHLGQLLQPGVRTSRRRCQLPAEGPRSLSPVADPQVLDLVGPVRLDRLRGLRSVHRLVPRRNRRPRGAPGHRPVGRPRGPDPVAALSSRGSRARPRRTASRWRSTSRPPFTTSTSRPPTRRRSSSRPTIPRSWRPGPASS